jgi:hypothetical protein
MCVFRAVVLLLSGASGKTFFFEKKNQKTFTHGGNAFARHLNETFEAIIQKFFASFFQKRSPSFFTCVCLPRASLHEVRRYHEERKTLLF